MWGLRKFLINFSLLNIMNFTCVVCVSMSTSARSRSSSISSDQELSRKSGSVFDSSWESELEPYEFSLKHPFLNTSVTRSVIAYQSCWHVCIKPWSRVIVAVNIPKSPSAGRTERRSENTGTSLEPKCYECLWIKYCILHWKNTFVLFLAWKAWKCSFLDDQIVRQLGPAESESKEIGLKSSKGKPNEGSWWNSLKWFENWNSHLLNYRNFEKFQLWHYLWGVIVAVPK
jgi:hypothetical protein